MSQVAEIVETDQYLKESQKLLLGDEALAQAALDAGISAAYGYPGTPSTEIIEYLQHNNQSKQRIIAKWSTNEKTAYEEAVGVSYVGKRVLATMKHVGLNVAADPFMNSALLKIHGGLVLAVADDPGMHSSQNEQDSRFFADFAKIVCFEPRNHQEVYDMTREAFDLSESFNIPVMIRLVTRLAHSRASIMTYAERRENTLEKAPDRKQWMAFPELSRKNWASLLKDQKLFKRYSENSQHNSLTLGTNRHTIGVISSGVGTNYFLENCADLPDKPAHLHVGFYPIPEDKIRRLAHAVNTIIVIEEGYPFIENQLRSTLPQEKTIFGKMDRAVPPTGELNPDIVREVLGLPPKGDTVLELDTLPKRAPQLCKGCSHRDTFEAINEALSSCESSVVTSDIGCYSLGALPPYSSIETILCMGASIGMAKGAAEVGQQNVIATIGDSTFLHSGITPLIDAVAGKVSMTVIILDNSTTAMTGGQQTLLTSSQIEQIIQGVGVEPEHIQKMIPIKSKKDENVAIIKKEVAYNGVSVIISLRECIQTLRTKKGSH